MRILQIVQKPQRRGAEIFAYQLSQWLRTQGHEVRTAYLYAYDGSKPLPLESDDVALSAVEHHPFERLPAVQPALLRRLRNTIRDFSPQIVQVNGARTVKYGAVVKATERAPDWKLIYRNIDSPDFWMKGRMRTHVYRRYIMSRMDGVIGVSQKTLKEVQQLYHLNVPSTFIPNGVDFGQLIPGTDRNEVRDSQRTPRDAIVALFMGNLTAQKRPDRFLRVLHRATQTVPNLYGWVLGDGPERAALEVRVAELNLDDRVRFVGYREQVAPFVDATDFYVSSSDTEGIPAVVLEVGYLGKPTVGMRVGGMHECVLEGRTGYLVEAADEEALVRRIVQLARNPCDCRRLGEYARDWSRKEFSIEGVGARYFDFYQLICSSRLPVTTSP